MKSQQREPIRAQCSLLSFKEVVFAYRSHEIRRITDHRITFNANMVCSGLSPQPLKIMAYLAVRSELPLAAISFNNNFNTAFTEVI